MPNIVAKTFPPVAGTRRKRYAPYLSFVGPRNMEILLILAIPLYFMIREAKKPELAETEEWTERELQGGFWYRFLSRFVMMILGFPSIMLVVIGVIGGGLYWIAAGAALLVVAFVVRFVVIPALWPSSSRGNSDDTG